MVDVPGTTLAAMADAFLVITDPTYWLFVQDMRTFDLMYNFKYMKAYYYFLKW